MGETLVYYEFSKAPSRPFRKEGLGGVFSLFTLQIMNLVLGYASLLPVKIFNIEFKRFIGHCSVSPKGINSVASGNTRRTDHPISRP